jgi:hypothetical protein
MSKIYCVIALLDDSSKQNFFELRDRLEIPESKENELPHITISVYDKDINLDELINWTKQTAENLHKFKVIYKSVGITLGSCLVAVPTFSPQLFELYYNHHQKFDECCRYYNALKNSEYAPHTGLWYPDRETAYDCIGKLAETFQSFEAEITAIRITEVDYDLSGYNFINIAEFELK